MDEINHELHAAIMAAALASVLEPNEGVIIHHDGDGYFVFLVHDPEDDTYSIAVNINAAYLQVPNFERVDIEEYAELTSDEKPKVTLQ